MRSPTDPRRAVALAIALLAPAAASGTPFFSGPSVVVSGQPARFHGGDFAPHAPLQILVKTPGGQQSAHGTVAAADGSLQWEVAPAQAGAWVFEVVDATGRTLGRAQLAVRP